ncbi:DUF4136 domain-containing protein [Desulfosediminicola flagellatus]|uniref:DUF4136 domain-containing protein n=1 Tax=Desulfosediminicola flagellatus TaxID=2569541 RepID=UPI0010AC782E|nr:DUF4136 domain-containing protein [Desulfosediminicola flagellatus]
MKNWISTAIIVVLLLLTGCSKVQVSQDYRAGMDFSQYRQYQWKTVSIEPADDIRVNNPLLHERFRQAIDSALLRRGFVVGAPADFLITYTYSIQARLESDPVGTTFGFGVGRHHRYSEIGYGTGNIVRQYDVGILAVDVIDVPSGTLAWRGTGSEIVTTHSTPEATTAFVYRMVDSILAQFPPP